MNSYKIYLSKSPEATAAIYRGYTLGQDDVCGKGHGAIIDDNADIPNRYKNCGFSQCTIVFTTPDGMLPTYEIIFC